jgi:hypothetical protein
MALLMYIPSSKYKGGDPIGFHRWIMAHKATGVINKNMHLVGFFIKRVTIYSSKSLKSIVLVL